MNVLLQPHQAKEMLERVPGGKNQVRNYTFLRTLVGSGVRVGELCPLKLGDIDWNCETIRVCSKGTRDPGVRYVNSGAFADLHYYIQGRFGDISTLSEADQRYVFPSDDGNTPISPHIVSAMFHRMIRNCSSVSETDRNQLTVHSFRQFYAVTQLRSGLDNEIVRILLGCRFPDTIEMRWRKILRDNLDQSADPVSIRLAGVSESHLELIHGERGGNL